MVPNEQNAGKPILIWLRNHSATSHRRRRHPTFRNGLAHHPFDPLRLGQPNGWTELLLELRRAILFCRVRSHPHAEPRIEDETGRTSYNLPQPSWVTMHQVEHGTVTEKKKKTNLANNFAAVHVLSANCNSTHPPIGQCIVCVWRQANREESYRNPSSQESAHPS